MGHKSCNSLLDEIERQFALYYFFFQNRLSQELSEQTVRSGSILLLFRIQLSLWFLRGGGASICPVPMVLLEV